MPGGIPHDQRDPAIFQGQQVVIIAAHLVGGAVGVGDGPAGDDRHVLRQQGGLELAGHLELVAHADAVHQLESEQVGQGEEAQGEPERREVEEDLDRAVSQGDLEALGESEEQAEERQGEDQAPRRRQLVGEAEEGEPGAVEPPLEPLRRLGLLRVVAGEHRIGVGRVALEQPLQVAAVHPRRVITDEALDAVEEAVVASAGHSVH
jgi:hypothetical protein